MLIRGPGAWKRVEIAQKIAPGCPRGVRESWKVGKEIPLLQREKKKKEKRKEKEAGLKKSPCSRQGKV